MVALSLMNGTESLVEEQVPLRKRTTWRIGGPARWLAKPTTVQALSHLWADLPDDLPRVLLGRGSNILVDDAGFRGLVIDLSQTLNRIERVATESIPTEQEGLLLAEAGATTRAFSHFARRHGLTGAEFLSGIPGSLGGALRMNAGAHQGDIASLLVKAQVMDTTGKVHTLSNQQLGFGYRHVDLPAGWLFLSGLFRLPKGHPEQIRATMQRLNQQRRQNQPLDQASAGSTFKNPRQGPAAWRLIDEAGLRGSRIGEAQVSEKHTNFLINRGQASSRDMLTLIDKVRGRVLHTSGITLALEVTLLGPEGFRPHEPSSDHRP